MNFKNEGLTVGELSIAIAALIIVYFLWTSLTKDKNNQDVSMLTSNLVEISYIK